MLALWSALTAVLRWNVATAVILLNVLVSLFSSAYDDVSVLAGTGMTELIYGK
jgi:hypothetical protein